MLHELVFLKLVPIRAVERCHARFGGRHAAWSMEIKPESPPNRQNENPEQSAERGPEWPQAEFRFELVGTLRKPEGTVGTSTFSGSRQGNPKATTLRPNDQLQG